MTFQETLDFLYKQLPVFHRDGASAYKKDLTRTIELLEFLGNPHHRFKSIHVAGTNGKGSSSHLLASILQESGYKTGLYTSPHIKHFGERIKINGAFIAEEFVIEFVKNISPLLVKIEPSFFELTVAMAFQYFAENKVDIVVVETGLGGRLDSTNVISPLACLITNISYDHADLLGNTLGEISREKAGIIKEKVPVVISERQNEVENVFIETARNMSAGISFASDNTIVSKEGYSKDKMLIKVTEADRIYELESGLSGEYQIKNIAGVLNVIKILQNQDFKITAENIERGISNIITNTGLKGRWQKISDNPLIICDIAHNEAGIAEVLNSINELEVSNLHIVMGMVKDKDIAKVLAILPKQALYYFTQAHTPRALSAEDLRVKALDYNLQGEEFENVNLAIENAKSKASSDDLIVVCGSTFLIAEVEGV